LSEIGFRLCSEACSTRLRFENGGRASRTQSDSFLTGRKLSDSDWSGRGLAGKGKPCPCPCPPMAELTCGPRPSHTHISQPMETGPRPTQSSISHGNDLVWMTQSSAYLCIEVSSASLTCPPATPPPPLYFGPFFSSSRLKLRGRIACQTPPSPRVVSLRTHRTPPAQRRTAPSLVLPSSGTLGEFDVMLLSTLPSSFPPLLIAPVELEI
jgi:hypothetical protein